MRDIHCGTPQPNNADGHFLARVNGDKIELWCAKCKVFHPVKVIDIVAQSMTDLRNVHETEPDKRLLW